MHDNLHGSLLIISHQERILNIADEILLIADGELVKQGSKDEILPQLLGTADAAVSCQKVIPKTAVKSENAAQSCK